jgi:hypothetical protein
MSSARQQDNEPLAEYYKRFTSACVDVGESKWGSPVPTILRRQQQIKRMRNCQETKVYNLLFFAGVDTKRHGKLKLPKDGRECCDNIVTLHE